MAGPLSTGIGRPDINHTKIPGAYTRPGISGSRKQRPAAMNGKNMLLQQAKDKRKEYCLRHEKVL